jgi:hypothetical protein
MAKMISDPAAIGPAAPGFDGTDESATQQHDSEPGEDHRV